MAGICDKLPFCCSGFLSFVMLACVGLLIFFGVTLVKPYRYTVDFRESTCMAVNVTSHGYQDCDCIGGDDDDRCTSVYPCEEIKIAYAPIGITSEHHTSQYQQYFLLRNQRKCAVEPCTHAVEGNIRSVADFVNKYGHVNSNSSYECLYNPESWDEVIIYRPPVIHVIMAMLWPSVFILAGAIFLFILRCKRCDDYTGLFRKSANNYIV